MINSRDVFAKRKEGALVEAYQMALELMQSPHISDWDVKAYAWCLIDLIKLDMQAGNHEDLNQYQQQLQAIKLDPNDEVLSKSVRYVLSLYSPNGQLIIQAKELSKHGRHQDAVNLYRKILLSGSADRIVQTSLGWELYKLCKEIMARDNINLNVVKRELNDYLKLDVEKPSLLHSCILQLASKLFGDSFSMMAFSMSWNLDYLRPEDYDRFHGDDGKDHPSLAEKVVQQSSKEASKSDNTLNLEYILPYINTVIDRHPDNIWLKLDKAKVLLALKRNDEALAFGLDVVKSKINDYWAWELLGDISAAKDPDAALGCYCKALLISNDDKYTGKVRLKLAERMLEVREYAAARLEVELVISYREREGQRISDNAARLAAQSWYLESIAASSNVDYYKSKVPAAEALLLSQLPWINGCVGEKFTIPGKEGKPKRRLYIKTSTDPTEVIIPESKGVLHGFTTGDAMMLKGEMDSNGRFQVYVIKARDEGSPWDIFPEKIGVVDHVNEQKKLVHFIVDRNIDGIIPHSELTTSFKEGDVIALKLTTLNVNQGKKYKALQAQSSTSSPDSSIFKEFHEKVRESKGMGFTINGIFVSSVMMNLEHILDGDLVSGVAIINYDNKRKSWGWKAISIKKTTPS